MDVVTEFNLWAPNFGAGFVAVVILGGLLGLCIYLAYFYSSTDR